jgi:large subunit ribosomal protein L23
MEVLVKPLITEKMTAVSEKFPNRYGFIVNKAATKSQIRHAVEEMYDVTVVSVNTMVYLGKLKTRYTRTGIQSGRKKSFKKAIITLDEGQTIDFYSNI